MTQKKVLYRNPPKRARGGRPVPKDNHRKEVEYKKALIYARVSSITQRDEGHGLESQEQRCRQYAQQNGYEVEAVFKDSITGAGDFRKRPAMVELLEYLDARPAENYVVIFDDLKRLARDVVQHLKLRMEFSARDARVESPNFRFDNSEEGEFIEIMFSAQGALERKQNRRQVIQKMRARLESGYWPFGPRKGYGHIRSKVHGVLAVPTDKGTDILKPALEMFASGVFERKIDLARHLMEQGFWKKANPEIYIDKLTRILEDPFYCGDIYYPSWNVERREGKHEGIISRETFELIQKRLKKESSGARVRIDTTPDFPLRGLVLCAGCGRKLTAAWSSNGHDKKYGYYVCQTKNCEIGTRSIAKARVEEGFGELLKQSTLKPGVENLIASVFEDAWKEEREYAKDRRHLIEEKVRQARERRTKLTDEILRAKSEELKEVYEEELEAVAHEIKELESSKPLAEEQMSVPYQNALTKATQLLKNPYSAWENLDVFEQHRLFFFVFEERLAYSKTEGYQTQNSSIATRLFEEFVADNPLDVEVGGIEPPSESLFEDESTTRSPRFGFKKKRKNADKTASSLA